MEKGCVKELFANPVEIEKLEECARKILKYVTMININGKILLKYKGNKVGFLIIKAPVEEIKVVRYWIGPFCIKSELSYQNKFVGVLVIKNEF
jgi:hypothetical protein